MKELADRWLLRTAPKRFVAGRRSLAGVSVSLSFVSSAGMKSKGGVDLLVIVAGGRLLSRTHNEPLARCSRREVV